MSVHTLGNLLIARAKRDREAVYQSELIYLLVKRHYTGVTPPLEASKNIWRQQRKEKPTKQIIADILRKLGS